MTHRMSEMAIAVPSAVKPASRPKIRKTPTTSWDPRCVRWRLMNSTARMIAVAKPRLYSVPRTSLSIVLGIPTTGNPRVESVWA